MKRCPECSNTYPDAERFCSSDGAALVPADSAPHATVQMAAPGAPEPQVECPVCGGKALPGEELCSFCGTRLGVAQTPLPPPSCACSARNQTPAEARQQKKKKTPSILRGTRQ